MHNINKAELVSKVLINVLFISLFITVFFFTYGSYIEKKVVIDQMFFLSKDIKSLFSIFGENVNNMISEKLDEVVLPDLSKEDAKTKANNDEIKKKTGLYLLLFVIITSVIINFIYIKYGNNSYQLNEILSENLVILIAIGITEYVFLTYFGARYVSINPSNIKLSILKSLRDKKII